MAMTFQKVYPQSPQSGKSANDESNAFSLRKAMLTQLNNNIWPGRFARNMGLFTAAQQAKLLYSRAFVLGCGGLGGHVAALLARTGIGALRLVDCDIFEESNLNRQQFCTERTLGHPKAAAVAAGLADIGAHLELESIQTRATADNLPDMVASCDIVLDCLDNLPDRFALEDAALAAHIPFVHGAVLLDEGFCFVNTGSASKMPQLYPQGKCDTTRAGSIDPVIPAAIASLMVKLAVRALIAPEKLSESLYHLDLAAMELERFSF